VHFGHYKAGTYNNLVNSILTLLTVIPMTMGYYQTVVNGINVMLEKFPVNSLVDKVHIIILFEVETSSINMLDVK